MAEAPSPLERLRAIEAAAAAKTRGQATPERRGDKRKQGLAGAATVGLALLWKFKAALLLFLGKAKLLLGALKLGQIFTTTWTMALMVWVYAQYYGVAFAGGLVLLILVHELGHGAAARRVGIPVGAPVFIPFFGASIALKARPRDSHDEFIIAAGGPLFGSLAGALVLALAAAPWGSAHVRELLYALGFFTLVLNLFNLTPFWQLDGARMVKALEPRPLLVGTAALVLGTLGSAALVHHLNPMALGVTAVCGYRAYQAHAKRPPETTLDKLEQITTAVLAPAERAHAQARRGAFVYFGLACALVVAVQLLHAGLPAMR